MKVKKKLLVLAALVAVGACSTTVDGGGRVPASTSGQGGNVGSGSFDAILARSNELAGRSETERNVTRARMHREAMARAAASIRKLCLSNPSGNERQDALIEISSLSASYLAEARDLGAVAVSPEKEKTEALVENLYIISSYDERILANNASVAFGELKTCQLFGK